MRDVKDTAGEKSRAARKKQGDTTPPAVKLSITLPHDVAEFVEDTWREHELRDGSLTRNVSQFIADILRRELDRRAARTKRR
ncbi:MAG: hypothetical protein ACREM8_02015 [Vulcanimicrobiaceae bacterium]